MQERLNLNHKERVRNSYRGLISPSFEKQRLLRLHVELSLSTAGQAAGKGKWTGDGKKQRSLSPRDTLDSRPCRAAMRLAPPTLARAALPLTSGVCKLTEPAPTRLLKHEAGVRSLGQKVKMHSTRA